LRPTSNAALSLRCRRAVVDGGQPDGRNTTGRKRRFGRIRKLPSGNWQVRYRGPDGSLRTDDQTYPTKTAAEARLADLRRREWVDPDAGQISLTKYAEKWVAERDLEDRTRELFAGYLRNHIGPTIGDALLCELSAPRVRAWRSAVQQAGVGPRRSRAATHYCARYSPRWTTKS
jgi:hypothetical protein